MSNDFMPMSLNSLNTAYSTKTTSPSISDLERQGINVIEQGKDTGLQFEDFLQLMVQQLQNQTMDNTADTSEMLNQLVHCGDAFHRQGQPGSLGQCQHPELCRIPCGKNGDRGPAGR